MRDEYHKEGATSDNNCPNGIGVNKRIAVYTFGKSLAEDKKKLFRQCGLQLISLHGYKMHQKKVAKSF